MFLSFIYYTCNVNFKFLVYSNTNCTIKITKQQVKNDLCTQSARGARREPGVKSLSTCTSRALGGCSARAQSIAKYIEQTQLHAAGPPPQKRLGRRQGAVTPSLVKISTKIVQFFLIFPAILMLYNAVNTLWERNLV